MSNGSERQLRRNPNPEDTSTGSLIQNLDEYLRALTSRTEAATEKAELLARYNVLRAELEETKGTILAFYGVSFPLDPCVQNGSLFEPPGIPDPPSAPAQATLHAPRLATFVTDDPAANNEHDVVRRLVATNAIDSQDRRYPLPRSSADRANACLPLPPTSLDPGASKRLD